MNGNTYLILSALVFSTIAFQLKSSRNTAIKSQDKNPIVGTYYINSFDHQQSGFVLLQEPPDDREFLHFLEFKDNGRIVCQNQSEYYNCGNGMLILDSGRWEAQDKNTYRLSFKGEYVVTARFNVTADYQLQPLEDGNRKLQLIKRIKYEEQKY